MMSECQVISHDPFVKSIVLMVRNDRKCITYNYDIRNKTIMTNVLVDIEFFKQ